MRSRLTLPLTVALVAAWPSAVVAQEGIEIGLKSGFARNSLTSGREFLWTGPTSSSAAFVRYPLRPRVALQLETLVSSRVGESEIAGTLLTMEASSLETPLLVQWEAAAIGPLSAYVAAGPLLAYRYSCRLRFQGGGVVSDSECDAARGVQSNRVDLGGVAGIGARLALGLFTLQGELRGSHGISTNVLPIDSTSARNAGWGAMVGASVPVSRLRRSRGATPAGPFPRALPAPLSAQPRRQDADAARPVVLPDAPAPIRISVDADDVDLAEVVAGIASATHTPIAMDPRIRRRITLALRDVTAEEAMAAIAHRTGLAMVRSLENGRFVMALRPVTVPAP